MSSATEAIKDQRREKYRSLPHRPQLPKLKTGTTITLPSAQYPSLLKHNLSYLNFQPQHFPHSQLLPGSHSQCSCQITHSAITTPETIKTKPNPPQTGELLLKFAPSELATRGKQPLGNRIRSNAQPDGARSYNRSPRSTGTGSLKNDSRRRSPDQNAHRCGSRRRRRRRVNPNLRRDSEVRSSSLATVLRVPLELQSSPILVRERWRERERERNR